jgi:hypothetical protein
MGAGPSEISTVVATIATALSAAASTSLFKDIITRWAQKRGSKIEISKDAPSLVLTGDSLSGSFSLGLLNLLKEAPQTSPVTIAKRHVLRRIEEAEQAMVKQNVVARTNRWADHLLTFGQYVIGGVLASSFVQQSLSPAIVGFLGVLVLIASLIKQQFHPDASARDATQKVGKLRALIRSAEDQLAELITRADADAGAYHALAQNVSRGLGEIELTENKTVGPPASSVK